MGISYSSKTPEQYHREHSVAETALTRDPYLLPADLDPPTAGYGAYSRPIRQLEETRKSMDK